jgi:hypothetical protein
MLTAEGGGPISARVIPSRATQGETLFLPAAAFPTPFLPPRCPLRLPPAKPGAARDGDSGDPRVVPWCGGRRHASAPGGWSRSLPIDGGAASHPVFATASPGGR